MPVYNLNINNSIAIQQALNVSFDRMSAVLPEIEERTLKSGASSLKEKVKETFVSKMPSAARPIRKPLRNYAGTALVEGVRQTKVNKTEGRVRVHILGSGGHDMTFATRFYEYDTKKPPRYNRNYKGMKLKKRRSTGKLTGLHFFESTINAELSSTEEIMGTIYQNILTNTLNEA